MAPQKKNIPPEMTNLTSLFFTVSLFYNSFTDPLDETNVTFNVLTCKAATNDYF